MRNGHSDPYAGPADERYRAFREQFERQHGRIVDEYWCSDEASAAVVCLKEAARPLRWLGKDPSARIYSETNWKTRDLPVPVAELVHEADALAMHAREVLRSTAQRLVIQRLFGVIAYLLGTFDGKDMTDRACKPVIESASKEVAEIRQEYVTAATRSAQIVYFWGMVSGLAWLGVLGAVALPVLARRRCSALGARLVLRLRGRRRARRDGQRRRADEPELVQGRVRRRQADGAAARGVPAARRSGLRRRDLPRARRAT